ncbi:phosphatidylinositol 4-kinase beta [Medicago truncatula]|uniref:1-phosphatidylinositol 4-kinase n=1 Tax=Medicago truncatula TaxID=3880 RepID=G7JBJ1_MEDTR|nr:phosphatidylinositol 4-kinase beta [Medicago truncatula]
MVSFLGLTHGEGEQPREITSRSNRTSESSENGWLIRFFDSSFFCEWIAVSYLYKHDHAGVRNYLCNRMYTLPLQGIEGYLFQVCYMTIYKPNQSLDKFVIDVCSKSLKIALKVHWFLLAELEDDNDGISRIQEKCQIAATLMGEWPPLIWPQSAPTSPAGKSQVLNRILSSKHRLLSLTSSSPTQRSLSFLPSLGNNLQDDGSPQSPKQVVRQEHLAVQLISHFYDIFQEAGLPLWLRPYEVLCTSSYTALIETIQDTASLHSIKSRYLNISSLREFFIAKYEEDSPSFKLAQFIQGRFLTILPLVSLLCHEVTICLMICNPDIG